eukprot:TRINITY_DN26476_c0_g1_i1.p1 TRINITY_DN26476_c0_g1~~TRINITY_DN26476_c0_g1_i1.p1  ORF type:complete len:181 (+),score=48.12 TRINITY_DN26476_c0_g1_i1:128-670(+)
MPEYGAKHSVFNDASRHKAMYGLAILPIRTRFPGPAPQVQEGGGGKDFDVIDEALRAFRWNILFRNFEVKGPGDRVLIYLTCWISKCLSVASQASNYDLACRQLEAAAASELPGPGDDGFGPLTSLFSAGDPRDAADARNYLKQLRQETLNRLLPKLFENGVLNKHWMQFAKRKFMGIAF